MYCFKVLVVFVYLFGIYFNKQMARLFMFLIVAIFSIHMRCILLQTSRNEDCLFPDPRGIRGVLSVVGRWGRWVSTCLTLTLIVPRGRLSVPRGRLSVPRGRLSVPRGRLGVSLGWSVVRLGCMRRYHCNIIHLLCSMSRYHCKKYIY